MADERHGTTRRDAIRSAAVAAGLVWTAPAVKSVRLLAASGTPAPPTSNAEPSGRVIDFTGSMTGTFTSPGSATCENNNPSVDMDFAGDLTSLGQAAAQLDVCTGPFDLGIPITGGTFSLQASGGTLTGTATGGFLDVIGSDFVTDVAVSGGSGAFTSAVGTAQLFGTFGPGPGPTVPATATLTGTITVPA